MISDSLPLPGYETGSLRDSLSIVVYQVHCMTVAVQFRIIAKLCPIPCTSHEDFINMIVDSLGPCSFDYAQSVCDKWSAEVPVYWDGYSVNYMVQAI